MQPASATVPPSASDELLDQGVNDLGIRLVNAVAAFQAVHTRARKTAHRHGVVRGVCEKTITATDDHDGRDRQGSGLEIGERRPVELAQRSPGGLHEPRELGGSPVLVHVALGDTRRIAISDMSKDERNELTSDPATTE